MDVLPGIKCMCRMQKQLVLDLTFWCVTDVKLCVHNSYIKDQPYNSILVMVMMVLYGHITKHNIHPEKILQEKGLETLHGFFSVFEQTTLPT